jgi:hypothetical protein
MPFGARERQYRLADGEVRHGGKHFNREDAIKKWQLIKARYPKRMGASMLLILGGAPITEEKIQNMA